MPMYMYADTNRRSFSGPGWAIELHTVTMAVRIFDKNAGRMWNYT